MAEKMNKQGSGMDDRLRCNLKIIATPSELAAVSAEWLAFLKRSTVTAGFFTDLRVIALNANFDKGDSVLIARVLLDGDLAAIVPLICRRSRVPVRFGLLRICLISASVARLADFDFPREQAISPYEVFDKVIKELRKLRLDRFVDILFVDSAFLPEPSDYYWASKLKGVQTTYTINVTGSFHDYLECLSSKERNNIKRRVNRLAGEDNTRMVVKCYRDPCEMEELRQNLQLIWRESWHAKLGQQQVPDLEYFKVLAGYGWMRSYVLFLNESPVAYICGYQYNHVFYHEGTAYDGAVQKLSPGIVLLFYVIEHLNQVDCPQTLDFGFGYGEYKSTFGTYPSLRGMIRVPISFRGQLIVTVLDLFDVFFRWCKVVMARTSIPGLIKLRIRGRR